MAEATQLSINPADRTAAIPSFQNRQTRDAHRFISLSGGTKTISSGVLALAPNADNANGAGFWVVSAESGTEDTITSITGLSDGDVVQLVSASGHTIILDSTQAIFGIRADIYLNEQIIVMLRYEGGVLRDYYHGDDIAFVAASGAVTALANHCVIPTHDSTAVVIEMPEKANFGDVFEIVGKGSAGWELQSNDAVDSQKIWQGAREGVGSSSENVALVYSVNAHDSIKLVCAVGGDNQVWVEVLGNVAILLDAYSIRYLAQAAGGAGGTWTGGGGSGGDTLDDTTLLIPGETYTITVGAGVSNSQGGSTTFSGEGVNIIAVGGVKGSNLGTAGVTGSMNGSGAGGEGAGFAGGTGENYDGGDSNSGAAGGGAGSGEDGGDAGAVGHSNGGEGLLSDITGIEEVYGSGGGGGKASDGNWQGYGGTNAGDGDAYGLPGQAGTDGFGGGGGGSGSGSATTVKGGDGCFIIRVLSDVYATWTDITGSPSVSVDGNYTVITWTEAASFVA